MHNEIIHIDCYNVTKSHHYTYTLPTHIFQCSEDESKCALIIQLSCVKDESSSPTWIMGVVSLYIYILTNWNLRVTFDDWASKHTSVGTMVHGA